jgi:hypothetical protein
MTILRANDQERQREGGREEKERRSVAGRRKGGRRKECSNVDVWKR